MEPEPLGANGKTSLANLRGKRVLVGLNVSKLLYMGGYSRSNMFGLKEEYVELTRRLILSLVEEGNTTVLLVAHVAGGTESEESEVTLNGQLVTEWKPKVGNRVVMWDGYLSHRQTKTLIGECDFFVGARMHACIAAVSQCVPTVALAYSDKFAGVMNLVGDGVQVVDLRSTRWEGVNVAVRGALSRRDYLADSLRRRIPALKQEITGFFQSEKFAAAVSVE